jgi:RNA polymerase sigma factor for flagellar operon FliA
LSSRVTTKAENPPKDSPEVLARFHASLSFVRDIARKLRRGFGLQASVEELESYGQEGLLHAARRFDPAVGVKFETFAYTRVRGAMIDATRRAGVLSRRRYRELCALKLADGVRDALVDADAGTTKEDAAADASVAEYLRSMATAMAVGLIAQPAVAQRSDRLAESEHAVLESEDVGEPSTEEKVAERELLEHVHAAIARLPDVQQKLVERQILREGVLLETAKELGLNPSWASRLLSQAIDALAKDLKRRIR